MIVDQVMEATGFDLCQDFKFPTLQESLHYIDSYHVDFLLNDSSESEKR